MTNLGLILFLIGLAMAGSGFSARWQEKNRSRYNDWQVQMGDEKNYHAVFRKTWWIPMGLGLVIVILS